MIFLSLLSLILLANGCIHDQLHYDLEFLAEPNSTVNARVTNPFALTTQQQQSIRIYPLYFIDDATPKTKLVIQEYLVPRAIDYFQATLKLNRVQGNITITTDLICGQVSTPDYMKTEGVATDLILVVTGGSPGTDTYLAYARACNLLTNTERAGVGLISFNLDVIDSNTYTVASLQNDLITTLHEFTHVLGFSSSLYPYFRNATTGTRVTTSPVSTTTVNGLQVSLLSVPPLVSRLRRYFNCPTIEGAYLENQGDSSNQLSHFERRIFYNEYMTASDIDDSRLSEFTLAVLEGSGWYTVNYNMAEPLFWGKNEGCGFMTTPCLNSTTKQASFAEFCTSVASKGCTFTGRSQAYCGVDTTANINIVANTFGRSPVTDTFADNCPYMTAYENRDCKNSAFQSDRRIVEEKYGDNSQCFTGSIVGEPMLGTFSTSNTFCFEYQCEEISSNNYRIAVSIGKNKYYCTQEGSIPTLSSSQLLDCPDPNSFCTTRALPYCPRGCMGRGTCVSNQCVCQTGYEGDDCGFLAGFLEEIGALNSKPDLYNPIGITIASALGMLALITTVIISIRKYRAKKRAQGRIRPHYVDRDMNRPIVQNNARPRPISAEIVEIHENPQGFVEVNLMSQQDVASRGDLNATNQGRIPSSVPSITFD